MSVLADRTQAPGAALARPLFAPDIAVAATDPRDTHHRALPRETETLGRVVDRRLHDFAAGRVAAHRAMAALGLAVRPVPVGRDRAPVWPRGVAGSISHSQTACIAVAARLGKVRGLGIDVEEATALDPDLVAIVCTVTERAWLATLPAAQAGLMAKLIFSAKECAFKCQYPLTRTLFGFDALEITPDPDTGQFEATFARGVAPFSCGDRLAGRFALGAGLIVTAMTLRA